MEGDAMQKELCAELEALRANPNVYATFLRGNRQNLYKGLELELLKDDLKTKVLLKTHDGRKACLAALTALDKAPKLAAFHFRQGLHRIAQETVNDIAGRNATSTQLGLGDLLGKHCNVASTPKIEFKADRIVVFGPDLYTAKNIVAALLINDGVPDAKARNVLLSNQYQHIGVAVAKHPSQEYVVCLAVCTDVYQGDK